MPQDKFWKNIRNNLLTDNGSSRSFPMK